MKIIRIDRFTGKEEEVGESIAVIFTEEQFTNLKKGFPQYTFNFVYQLDSKNKETDYGMERSVGF